MPSNSIANSQFLINSQLVNSQITNSLLQNTNVNSTTLEDSINAEIEKFNDLDIPNNQQIMRYDTNNELDISRNININGTNFTLINTYEYYVEAKVNYIIKNNDSYKININSTLSNCSINTTYTTKSYRSYAAKTVNIDDIKDTTSYCVNYAPATLKMNNHSYKIMITKGHSLENDDTYSYEFEILEHPENSNEPIDTNSDRVSVSGSKDIFNSNSNIFNCVPKVIYDMQYALFG